MRLLSAVLLGIAVSLSAMAAIDRARAGLTLPPLGYSFTPAPGCNRPARGIAIYDDCADQMALFQRARAEAYGSNRQLLIVFGANWCPSCRSLKSVLDNADFKARMFRGKALADRVHVAEIAVSRVHDGRVAAVPSGVAVLQGVLDARPDLQQRVIPFVAVIDPVTGRTSSRNLDDLDGPHGWNAGAVATVLAAADEESRGGAKAPGEPGWIKRKLLRWFGP